MLVRNRIHLYSGFTLIELIVVMIVVGILAGVLFSILRGPVLASIDIQQRADLVDIAETALQRMTREVRTALPNSLRVTVNSIEFLRTIDGGRYRAKPPPGNRWLRFNNSALGIDGEFEVLGGLSSSSTATDCGTSCLLVIYNTGQTGANAYNGDNSANIDAFGAGPTTIDFVRSSGTGFPFESPQQRFQIVDTSVSYICNLGTGEVTRYDGYTVNAAPTTGSVNLLVDKVTACSFNYDAGSATRAGLAIFSLTITGDNGQSVTLMQQAHVDNQP